MKYRDPEYQDIEWQIMTKRYGQHFSLPRFTPVDWWECDVCEITRSGYFREFEIKMSRRDFLIDANKNREIRETKFPMKVIGRENKHDLLSARDDRGPSEFYYVTPRGLIPESDIPEWAGLIEVGVGAHRPYEVITKRAKKLHREKANPEIKSQMEKTAYWRFHHIIDNNYTRWRNKLTAPSHPEKPPASP